MINFENTETLSITYENKYIGDTFLYKSNKLISIRGYVESSGSGFVDIWQQINQLKPCAENDIIILNGCQIGSGKVLDVNFEPGNDIDYKNYTATISLLHSGNLINDLNNPIFSGIDFTGLDFSNVESISETLSYQKVNKSNYIVNKSLDLILSSGYGNNNPRDIAGILASGIFLTKPIIDCIEYEFPNFYQDYGNKVYSETCDELNYIYSFNEVFESDSTNNPYLWEYNHSLVLEENGVINIQENGRVKGNHLNKYPAALSGYNVIIGNAGARASGIYENYKQNPILGTSCNPEFKLISQSVDSDQCLGEIGYNIAITNDEAYLDDACYHTYSHVADKSQLGVVTVRQQGEIKGRGQTKTGKFSNALNCWQTVETEITGKVLDIYNNKYKQQCVVGEPILSDRSIDFSEYEGTINYSYTFNDEFKLSPDERFKNLVKVNSYNLPVPLTNNFGIINYEEIAQKTNQGTIGNIKNSINFVGRKGVELSDYVNFAETYLSLLPTGVDSPNLKNIEYSFNPNTYNFDMRADIDYVRYKDYFDNKADTQ